MSAPARKENLAPGIEIKHPAANDSVVLHRMALSSEAAAKKLLCDCTGTIPADGLATNVVDEVKPLDPGYCRYQAWAQIWPRTDPSAITNPDGNLPFTKTGVRAGQWAFPEAAGVQGASGDNAGDGHPQTLVVWLVDTQPAAAPVYLTHDSKDFKGQCPAMSDSAKKPPVA